MLSACLVLTACSDNENKAVETVPKSEEPIVEVNNSIVADEEPTSTYVMSEEEEEYVSIFSNTNDVLYEAFDVMSDWTNKNGSGSEEELDSIRASIVKTSIAHSMMEAMRDQEAIPFSFEYASEELTLALEIVNSAGEKLVQSKKDGNDTLFSEAVNHLMECQEHTKSMSEYLKALN